MTGAAIVFVLVITYLFGYVHGRGGVAEDCTNHRAFVYGTQAWGCVRLRKAPRPPGMDPSSNQGVDV